jgi:hypothetical protein
MRPRAHAAFRLWRRRFRRKASSVGYSALACAAASFWQPAWSLADRTKATTAVVGFVRASDLNPESAD